MTRPTRYELADQAATAWAKYDSACRFGGASTERRFAFNQAIQAEQALAAHDLATLPQRQRETAARALSGA